MFCFIRYLGTALYAFEGIAMLMPIEKSMQEPDKCARVVCYTMGASCLLQLCFACLAYVGHLATVLHFSIGRMGVPCHT